MRSQRWDLFVGGRKANGGKQGEWKCDFLGFLTGKFPSEILSCPPGAGRAPRNVARGIAQKSAASAERNQQLRQSHINQVNLQKRQNWKYFSENWEIYQGHICDFYLRLGFLTLSKEREMQHTFCFSQSLTLEGDKLSLTTVCILRLQK